jgi:hypothetical protein
MKMPETRLGKALATLAAFVALGTTVGGCVKSWSEAAAARQLATDEPKALAAYTAISQQVKDLQAEVKQLREAQVKFAGYFEGYLMARGATELPNKELAVPESEPLAPVASASAHKPAKPPTASSAKPYKVPGQLFILPPVPRPAPAKQQAVLSPPSPSSLGWE